MDWINRYVLDTSTQPVIQPNENRNSGIRSSERYHKVFLQRPVIARLIGWLLRGDTSFTIQKTEKNLVACQKLAFVQ